VLFKIESAYLHEDQRDTFITVTVEIEKLRALVEETFRRNAELLESAQVTLRTMHERLKIDFDRQEKLVGGKRQQITDAFENLDRQVATNATRDNNMHAISSALANEVSKVVMGLQFQDIFKQKCEQVLRGLEGYERSFSAEREDVSTLCPLDQAAAELDGGIGSVRTGVNLIRSHMEELEAQSLNQDDQGSEGLVQVLLDTIEDVNGIISGMAKLAEDAHTAVKPAGQIALSMSSALTELAINMQHIALNAQVRSVWIGAGTGLEELAARTAEISNQISHISEQSSQDLGVLQQSVNEMLTAFDAFHRRGSDQLTRLNTQRTSTESRLHSLRDHTISTIHTIGSGVDAIKTSATKLNEDLVRMDEVRASVLNNARDLASFLTARGVKPKASGDAVPVSTAAPSATNSASADSFQDFSDFSAPTNAAESEAHAAVSAAENATTPASIEPAPAVPGGKDALADFEDFSAPPSPPAPKSPVTESFEDFTDSSAQVDTPPPAAPEPSAPGKPSAPKTPATDSNVELF